MKITDTKKIIIADDNEFFRDILEERINEEDGLEVIKSLGNGSLVYEEILKGHADLVILDIIMPVLDGIGVLEKVQNENLIKKPKFICFSGLDEMKLVKKAFSMGASYYLKKPFSLEVLIERIKALDYEENNILEKELEDIMGKLGISQKVNGYLYIKKAILMVIKNNGVMDSITKVIYPYIANEYNTTDKNVERSIRSCIKRAFKDEKENCWYRLSLDLSDKPTNAEFIQKIANKLINIAVHTRDFSHECDAKDICYFKIK